MYTVLLIILPTVGIVFLTDLPPQGDFCVFGSPTLSCYMRCVDQKLTPFCEDNLGLCLCVEENSGDDKEDKQFSEPTQITVDGMLKPLGSYVMQYRNVGHIKPPFINRYLLPAKL